MSAAALTAAMLSPTAGPAAAVELLPCGPGTQQVTYSDAMPDFLNTTTQGTPSAWDSVALHLAKFNAAGGRVLTRADLTRTQFLQQRLSAHSNDLTGTQTLDSVHTTAAITTTLSPALSVLPPLTIDKVISFTPPTVLPHGEPGANVWWPGPSSADTYADSSTNTTTYTDASALGQVTGAGTVDMTGIGTGAVTGTLSGGNTGSDQYTKAKFAASITYSYVCSWMAITKTVVPPASGTVPADWSFTFSIAPGPVDGSSAAVTVTRAQPRAVWSGLVAGTAYTVFESASPGYTQGGVTCASPTAIGGQTVECTASNTVIQPTTTPPTPCVTPPAGTTPSPGATPPSGGTYCPVPVPTPSDTCAVVGSEGTGGCTAVPLTVTAKVASTVLPRNKWTKVVSSARTTAVATIVESVTCTRADGTRAKGCSKKYGSHKSIRVRVSKCTALQLTAKVTARPKAAYATAYGPTVWTRTWDISPC